MSSNHSRIKKLPLQIPDRRCFGMFFTCPRNVESIEPVLFAKIFLWISADKILSAEKQKGWVDICVAGFLGILWFCSHQKFYVQYFLCFGKSSKLAGAEKMSLTCLLDTLQSCILYWLVSAQQRTCNGSVLYILFLFFIIMWMKENVHVKLFLERNVDLVLSLN